MIPEDIKQKIKANASWGNDEQESIRNMEYGYSLAQQEIEVTWDDAMKVYARKIAIDFLDSIRDYIRESQCKIAYDERSSEDFYNIFIQEQQ